MGVLMGLLGMLVGKLAVLVSCDRMLLGLFVLSRFVVMDSFAVVVCRRLVMSGCSMVVFAGSMFHRHGSGPFNGANRRRFLQQDLQKARNVNQN
jgi:hypothetical protein